MFLKDGSTARGRVTTSSGAVAVSSPSGTIVTPMDGFTHVWRDGDKSPGDIAADALRRRWAYELAFDLNGRQGNSDRFFLGLSGRATVAGPDDKLVFYGSFSQADENGEKSQDEGRAGVDYTNLFSQKFSWYLRTELGYDKVRDLDLRSNSAAGLGYNVIKKEDQSLEFRAGVSYRFENYGTGEDFDSAGLDLGVMHSLQFTFGQMRNSLSYTPAFSDFGNFVASHESVLEMPFSGKRDIRLRVGVKNDYTSEPPPGLVKHDWSYFSSLVFTWK